MDHFIDKIAQKFSPQDVIKANLAAEAKETKRLREKVENYESLLSDLKKMNIENMASSEALLKEMNQVNAANKEENNVFLAEMRQLNQENLQLIDRLQQIASETSNTESVDLDGINAEFEKITEALHTENVKVYRNVQAAVNDSLDVQVKRVILEQQKLLQAQQKSMEVLNKLEVAQMNQKPKTSSSTIVLMVLILIASMANVVFEVIDFLNLGIF